MRVSKRAFSVILLIGLCGAACGQEDHIETDRDSFTRSPRTVAAGRTIVEGSYTYLDQDAEFDGHLYPDLLVRFGVSKWFEARLGWTYEMGKFHHLAPDDADRVEEGLLTYGAKVQLTEASAWLPDSSLAATGYTPTSGESNDTDFSLEYAFGWEWGHGWELDGGLRWFALIEEDDHFAEWAPSMVLKAPVAGERLNVHVEYFSLCSVNRHEDYEQHYVGPGAHFLITPNLEVGSRVFWGLSEDAAEFICNVGMGVRF